MSGSPRILGSREAGRKRAVFKFYKQVGFVCLSGSDLEKILRNCVFKQWLLKRMKYTARRGDHRKGAYLDSHF